jgi:RNA polymerase sigma-70 factor (ECF subfamily)
MLNNEKTTSDLDLVNLFRSGSLPAFEELLSRYESKAFNLAMRFVRNQEDAEEVLQDVFTTLYRKLESFEGKSAFSSWLYRIVVNCSFMKLRKRKQHITTSLEDLPAAVKHAYLENDPARSQRTDTEVYNREVRDAIEAAVSRLPEQYRAVFVLRDVDGLSNEQVGEVLELTVPAVKSRLHRARLMLRKKLHRFYEEYTGKKQSLEDKIEIELSDDIDDIEIYTEEEAALPLR